MTDPDAAIFGLVGDIGGTNARFAVAETRPGAEVKLHRPQDLKSSGYDSLESAAKAYLDAGDEPPISYASLACAGPVSKGEVKFTNLGWTVKAVDVAAALKVERVRLVNDLAAQAWAAPALHDAMLHTVGAGGGDPEATLAVLGVGTGSNAAALVRDGESHAVLSGEAGHASVCSETEIEMEIVRTLSRRFGHVSIERVLSGPGLLNIYVALAGIDDVGQPVADTPKAVVDLADAGDALAAKACEVFCGWLGCIAGDFALAFGARGGLFIGGGVVASMTARLDASSFRTRFEAKGRFQPYMAAIPTHVILSPQAALVGAARAAAAMA